MCLRCGRISIIHVWTNKWGLAYADTPFKQQKLKAWQPILTPNWVIGSFALVGLIFIPIGIILHTESDNVRSPSLVVVAHMRYVNTDALYSQVVEYAIQYDGQNANVTQSSNIVGLGSGCYLTSEDDGNTFDKDKRGCLITFDIEKDMKAPIFVYYQLDNFYQNHRRYVQSRSDAQLRGDASASTTDCSPLKKTGTAVIKYNSTSSTPLVSTPNNYMLNPCGLIANSLFNDIFWVNSLTLPDNGAKYYQGDTYNGKTLVNLLDQTNIAWKSDIDTKFKNIPEADRVDGNLYLWQNPRYRFVVPMYEGQPAETNKTAWTTNAPSYGVQDEHFIVWMRTAGLPSFRKLYGRIDTDLAAGTKLEFLVSSSTFLSACLFCCVCLLCSLVCLLA